ncbi:21142_t:CDS:2 [Dentiscutata erythropus]|uniref:21142_t:CDS:1 n=1 Tax=Dentiscutata erythropus TaxID=1348616 RepID=A0A9N8YSP6_9GLOM|nr:21142_t:CDS:2 [Dentiscutata erythropus]
MKEFVMDSECPQRKRHTTLKLCGDYSCVSDLGKKLAETLSKNTALASIDLNYNDIGFK